MNEYNEDSKNQARSAVLEQAILALTKNRKKSTIAPRNYVYKVRENLTSRDEDRAYHAKQLKDDTILRWEGFYDSIVTNKKPSELKIAYLSGPNPENDLKEMTKHGILPENIWAFESDNSVYDKAVISALSSEFPFIKLIKSNIGSFFSVYAQKFDIIYLDFCGPLPSRNKKQKTLKTITNILAYHSLTSLGVLITNVSLPSKEQDSQGYNLLGKLVASYLYPKLFLESTDSLTGLTEGPIAHSYTPESWQEEVKNNLEYYYGQYVTRLLIDMVTVISPYDNFARKSQLFQNLFSVTDKEIGELIHKWYHFDDSDEGGDVICETSLYPILRTFGDISEYINEKHSGYSQDIYDDKDYEGYCKKFLSQLSINDDPTALVKNVSALHILLGNDVSDNFHSESLRNINEVNWFTGVYSFCDYVLFHQIKELLFRQLSVPYHPSISATKRWRYQAKETNMYMDMIVLDECRYIYDWMPSIDMIENGLADTQRQLSFRFALDAISKHRRFVNPEIFFGTASVGSQERGFEAKWLEPRKTL